MKKIVSQLVMFAIAFVLIQNNGPGASKEVVYYAGGKSNTTTNASNAHYFGNIQEAYAKQLDLGTDWRIETR